MSTETLQITVPAELEKAVSETGLAPDGVQSLRNAFAPHFVKFHELATSAANVPPTSPKVAGALRLEFKRLRIAAEKTRKELKEDSLRRGKAIDGVNALLEYQLVPLEQAMEKIEKAAEIAEAARLKALKEVRAKELAPYIIDPSIYPLDTMTEEQWKQLFDGSKAMHEARLAAAAKAEAERIAAEKAAEEARIAKEKEEAAERERMKAENERLAKIAAEERAAREAAEKKAAEEKAAIEAKAKAEREAAALKAKKEREAALELARKDFAKVEAKRAAEAKAAAEALAAAEAKAAKERAEAERLAKIERERVAAIEAKIAAAELAERQAREAEQKAARIAAAAPDMQKFNAYADALNALEIPRTTTPEGAILAEEIDTRICNLVSWIEQESAKIGAAAEAVSEPTLF